jgi:hypothetical protein
MNAREARRKSAEFYLAENYLHEGVKRWIETGAQNEILDLQDDLVGLADLYGRLDGDATEDSAGSVKRRYVKARIRSIPLPVVDELMGMAIAARAKQWNARRGA